MTKHYVLIRQRCDNTVVKKIGPCGDERRAEMTERGVNINLDHVNYYTEVVEQDDEEFKND